MTQTRSVRYLSRCLFSLIREAFRASRCDDAEGFLSRLSQAPGKRRARDDAGRLLNSSTTINSLSTVTSAHGDTVILICEDVAVLGVASVTLTKNEKSPVAVGLPDITPVVAFKVNPGGSAPLPATNAHV